MGDEVGAVPDASGDIDVLCQVIAAGMIDRALADLVKAGFDDTRPSHGFIFQGLLAGDTTITQLAQRLGVSAQAMSKSVSELEHAGYLERRRDDGDGRARTIVMTERARLMLERSRRSRTELHLEIVDRLGPEDARQLAELLRSVCDLYGGLEVIAGQRLRPSTGRL